MFPLTHTYLATHVLKKKTALFIFGGILPDITFSSNGIIPREIHDNPWVFHKFILKKYPKMSDLSLGEIVHNNENGADFYSHKFEGGYCMNLGKKISKDIAKLLEMDEEKAISPAHNFIEAAVDSHVLKSHPEILDLYASSLGSLNLQEIEECVSQFLDMDEKIVLSELKFLKETFSAENMSSLENFANIVSPAYYKRKGIEADRKEMLRIVQKAFVLSKNCMSFLDNTVIKQMGEDLGKL